MNLNHLSLFTGFMGFDLAAEWAGWNNVAFVEKDEYCRQLIQSKYPKKKIYEDIKRFFARPYRSTVDVISGGFPCQPFSLSGNLKGTKDDRYLWPEMLRVISEIRPTWVVGENVANLTQVEQSGGKLVMETEEYSCIETEMVLETIRRDFENIGYRTEFFIIPACAVGAWHQRNRIWILAHSGSDIKRQQEKSIKDEEKRPPVGKQNRGPKLASIRHRGHLDLSGYFTGGFAERTENITCIPGIDDGFSSWIHQSHGLGNAIVPQVAYEIFHHINLVEHEKTNGIIRQSVRPDVIF